MFRNRHRAVHEVKVRGECMTPSLLDGQRIAIERRRIYWPGDVVVTRRDDRNEAHRFLGYRPSLSGLAAWTQADDSLSADPALLADRVLGRVEVRVSFSERARALRLYGRAMRILVRRITTL